MMVGCSPFTSVDAWIETHAVSRIQDSPLANVIPGRLRATDFASNLSMRRLEDRLRLCNRTHGATCAAWRLLNAELPTRVLDVGVDSTAARIRLVEPVNMRSAYITLSHRWGDRTDIVMTTRSTIQEFRNGIDMNMLPKVFADAVFACRQLRVRYLWIDTLCILQDDESDWERESARMADIYANSYLTIAASSSPHTCFPDFETRSEELHLPPGAISVGLPSIADAVPMLDTRDNPSGPRWLSRKRFVAFRMQRDHDATSWLYIHVGWTPSSTRTDPKPYFIGGFGRRFDPLAHEQLNSRGWTLQERLLSSRTVHYATDQMYWECEKTFVAEDGSSFDPSIFSLNSLIDRQCLPASEHGFRHWGHTSYIEGFSPQMENPDGRWRGGWLEHVQRYSERDLTVSHDKLPALSGLAAIIAARTGDEYLAGVWRDHVMEDLHWRVYRRDERRTGFQAIHSEGISFAVAHGRLSYSYGDKLWDVAVPPASRGPSWSWASLDGRIRFVPLDFTRLRASFVSCHIKNSRLNRFGTVKKGWMRLFVSTRLCWRMHSLQLTISHQGPLLEMHRSKRTTWDAKDPLGLGVLSEVHLDSGVSLGEAFFDLRPQFPCFAFFLDSSNCLVLKETGRRDHEYTRIGIAKFLRTDAQRRQHPLQSFTAGAHPLDEAETGMFPKAPWGPITESHPRTTVTIV